VSHIDGDGVRIGNEQIAAATVLWGAGVRAADIGKTLGVPLDSAGRVLVEPDLSIPGHPEIFVAGDLSNCRDASDQPLPGVAAVAKQQGVYVAASIRSALAGRPRLEQCANWASCVFQAGLPGGCGCWYIFIT
jgi:NADH:ubiquinone reductase (H+-translocating)